MSKSLLYIDNFEVLVLVIKSFYNLLDFKTCIHDFLQAGTISSKNESTHPDTMLSPLDIKYFFKFLANAIEDDLWMILLVSCFYSLANPLQDKYLFHKPFTTSHKTIYRSYTSDNSMKIG